MKKYLRLHTPFFFNICEWINVREYRSLEQEVREVCSTKINLWSMVLSFLSFCPAHNSTEKHFNSSNVELWWIVQDKIHSCLLSHHTGHDFSWRLLEDNLYALLINYWNFLICLFLICSLHQSTANYIFSRSRFELWFCLSHCESLILI